MHSQVCKAKCDVDESSVCVFSEYDNIQHLYNKQSSMIVQNFADAGLMEKKKPVERTRSNKNMLSCSTQDQISLAI